MIEFKKYPGINSDGGSIVLTIASGPVIIQDGMVLLDKHGDDEFWKFPGGKLRDDNSVQDNAKREVKEELGLEVDLIGDPFILGFDKDKNGVREYMMLIHYLASIVGGDVRPGRDVREWAWHDVNNLPDDCAPNIKPAVEYFKSK